MDVVSKNCHLIYNDFALLIVSWFLSNRYPVRLFWITEIYTENIHIYWFS